MVFHILWYLRIQLKQKLTKMINNIRRTESDPDLLFSKCESDSQVKDAKRRTIIVAQLKTVCWGTQIRSNLDLFQNFHYNLILANKPTFFVITIAF
jgi:hypothetical protein